MEEKLDPKKTCTIYIVRHGETDWNVKQILQGKADIPLNKTGLKQAEKAAKRLKSIKFDAAYSSDLSRAKKTTQIIAPEHNLAVRTRKVLRERAFGKFEGKSGDYFREELKDLLKEINKLSYKEKAKYKFPHGIESIDSCVSRFITFLREIAIAHPQHNVLVGTHGAMMRHLLIHVGFGTEKELAYGAIKNAGYVVILSDGVDFFVKETWGVKKHEG